MARFRPAQAIDNAGTLLPYLSQNNVPLPQTTHQPMKDSVAKLAGQLSWDGRIHLWRASVALALKDLKHTHRSDDLIDLEIVNDLV